MGKTASPLSFCASLDTKRKGRTTTAPTNLAGSLKPLQRFLCKTCDTSFTLARKSGSPRARFADDVVYEAVRLYVRGLPSYRSHWRLCLSSVWGIP
jgi:transposase-like protein